MKRNEVTFMILEVNAVMELDAVRKLKATCSSKLCQETN